MQIFRPKFLLVALAFWTAVCETQRLEANLYRVSIFLSYFTTLSSVRPLLSLSVISCGKVATVGINLLASAARASERQRQHQQRRHRRQQRPGHGQELARAGEQASKFSLH